MEPQVPPAESVIGRTIGNYVVRQKLGEGGMGSVYLAEHPAIGKKVALKILHEEFASRQDVVQRFFNEAKAVNDIQHPNIVDIVDFGSMGSLVYFIMEFLPGGSLADLLRNEAPLPPERALAIALQIADALTASHRAGIVHRDLKPDNVMLIQRGRDRDFVKLLDFGIAKLTGDKSMASTRTRTGMVMGTPHYMSPEQCEGKGTLDHRTDIYALGVVLFEMITGRVPFPGEGYGEVLVQHLTQPPPPMQSSRGIIPPHVEQVVLRALEKRPDARFPSMEQMMYAVADPVGYVEAHGGLGGFRGATLNVAAQPTLHMTGSRIAPLTPAPGTRMMPGASTTTLGGAAAEVGDAPPRKRKTGLVVGLGLALAAAGVAAAVVLGGGGGGGEASAPAAAPEVAPEPAPQPEPEVAKGPEAPAPPEVATPPEPPKKVALVIESTPPGAKVTVGKEKKPRGKTPYTIEVEPSDGELVVTLELSGYQPETKTIPLSGNTTVDVELEKKERRRSGGTKTGDETKTGGDTDTGGGSDDTLNPFEKKKRGAP